MDPSQELVYLLPSAQSVSSGKAVRYLVHPMNGGTGRLWYIDLYPGVILLTADFRMPQFTLPYIQGYDYLKLNYCMEGRCEVPLDNSRYAYLENGVLSVDLNQSLGALLLPTHQYRGLELILDLRTLSGEYPAAWRECGLAVQDAHHRLASRCGSLRLRPSPLWDTLARQLDLRLRSETLTLEDARFYALQLLHLLKTGADMEEITNSTLLTRGQHALAAQAEQRLTADLSVRISIEALAGRLGISASALKKYFVQVYGKPVSLYLREKRMEQAKRLLAESDQSICAIALSVGYQNQGKFGAVFRDAEGITPSEYRRLCRAKQSDKGGNPA